MGYALSNDDCWAQKCLLLTGEGANGKSTFINVLNELAGVGNYSALNIEQINKSEYNRQLLDGKLFNVSEETPTKALIDNSLFKSLATGGEVQVRSPYKEPYFIRNRAKLIFTCNELPGSPDNSYGFYRRLIIVPFDQTFTRDTKGYDPHIGTKLTAELPGVFNLAMEGYKRLVERQAFTECKKIAQTVDTYQEENDTVLFWAKEALVVHTNGGFNEHFAPIRDLYEAYKNATDSHGRKPITFIQFSRAIAKLRPDIWQGIPYEDRYGRQILNLGDNRESKVRGLKGISYQSFS
jgi:putative DNA primase/helicase